MNAFRHIIHITIANAILATFSPFAVHALTPLQAQDINVRTAKTVGSLAIPRELLGCTHVLKTTPRLQHEKLGFAGVSTALAQKCSGIADLSDRFEPKTVVGFESGQSLNSGHGNGRGDGGANVGGGASGLNNGYSENSGNKEANTGANGTGFGNGDGHNGQDTGASIGDDGTSGGGDSGG